MIKFWMVLVEGTRGCSRRHSEEALARTEAERLARVYFPRKVYLLEAVDSCSTSVPVTWNGVEEVT